MPANRTVVSSQDKNLIFKVHNNIKKEHLESLIKYTQNLRDFKISQNTSDWKDGKGRFASKTNLSQWLKKGRTIYSLLDKAGNLAGIIWFGSEILPTENNKLTSSIDPTSYGITFAIRLYGNARGKGLAVPYIQVALELFKATKAYKESHHRGIWLETSSGNNSAVATYQKFGCYQISAPLPNGRILMAFPD
jgi:ribosomal protein S18 acetylase RimI-like enzyme